MNSTAEAKLNAAGARLPRVLVVDADHALFGLLETWLAAEGFAVVDDAWVRARPAEAVDLVVVDVPFPRQAGVDWVQSLALRHPMAPILALSSTFIVGIECRGPVARTLGVACVLPNPVTRLALLNAVRLLLPL